MKNVRIEFSAGAPDAAILANGHWADLARRAEPNVFMHPVAGAAAVAAGQAPVRTLLAWEDSAGASRLLGLWTLSAARSGLGPSVLSGLPFNYAFACNPLVDLAHLDTVIPAFLDAIERDPSLENVLRLKYLDAGSETAAAIRRALSARSASVETLAERERPFVTRGFGIKTTGSTRKKLRQDWNRLCASGAVTLTNEKAPDAVRAAFEVFLDMEAQSWKGEKGTALLSNPEDARFARALVSRLSEAGAASVAVLTVDGKPVATQVLLYCGTTAYTWKCAFAASHAKFSPGALIVDKVTEMLFAEGGIEAIDSCSADGSFMDQMWSGRRQTLDLLADLGHGRSLGFRSVAAWQRGRAGLKSLRQGAGARAGAMTAVLAMLGFVEP